MSRVLSTKVNYKDLEEHEIKKSTSGDVTDIGINRIKVISSIQTTIFLDDVRGFTKASDGKTISSRKLTISTAMHEDQLEKNIEAEMLFFVINDEVSDDLGLKPRKIKGHIGEILKKHAHVVKLALDAM